ncbi:MAG: phosphatidate cytidylyltransferase [Bacteroidetes bacterium]|uniref:Phosphatidate cytidylyltransferase n=1 Tax=Candidatus Cryptobacteroides merdigallinarum TaxID=2840770 RepID=A0A9D9EH70_9BACT|nr:phosphatidate cytidylyltransferase [Candidatus Cryptobacteroides merdigallinarum]
MKNLILRTLTGIGFVAVVVVALLLNRYCFGVLMIGLMAVMMIEFFRMTMHGEYLFSQVLSILAAIVLFVLTYLYRGFNFPGRLVVLAIIPVFVVMINSLYVKDKTDFGKFANLYTSMLYIAVPVTMTNFAVFSPHGEYSGVLLLSLFIITWVSDIGGYLFGMTIGQKFGKKLFPEVSPKKSWAGFWGGLVLAVAAGAVLSTTGMLNYPLKHCIILSVLMNISGVYGDLIESQWKRYYAIKDTGTIMPGHGGILDRMDSALLALPTGIIYLLVVNIL